MMASSDVRFPIGFGVLDDILQSFDVLCNISFEKHLPEEATIGGQNI
jgi:hypothetical protein